MAQKLNQTRIRDTKVILIIAAFFILFTQPTFSDEGIIHEILDFIGYILVAICALGRVYSTAFLGGHKNKNLITQGPYSVVRNPLYSFSLLGITGIAMMTNHIIIMIVTPLIIGIIYDRLIKREEVFLKEEFGKEYDAYITSTPRLFPKFSNYSVSDDTILYPKMLSRSFSDAIWWFAFFPIIELLEYLQESGIVPTFNLF